MAFMFENLEVYQKAVDFAAEVARLTEGFPRGYGFLVDQLNRAAVSIATNLAEGNGRLTQMQRRWRSERVHVPFDHRGDRFKRTPVAPIRQRRIEQVKSGAGEQVKEPARTRAAIKIGVFDTCGHLIN